MEVIQQETGPYCPLSSGGLTPGSYGVKRSGQAGSGGTPAGRADPWLTVHRTFLHHHQRGLALGSASGQEDNCFWALAAAPGEGSELSQEGTSRPQPAKQQRGGVSGMGGRRQLQGRGPA